MPEDDHLAKSPFSTLLSSNVPPSDQDLVHLRSFVDDHHEQISILNKDIYDIERVFKARCVRQLELRKAIQAHESLLLPIRRIPQHILQEIFVLCRPAHRHPAIDKREAPLLLTHVCRLWRDIAQRTPKLWDSIHIPIPSDISVEVLLFHLESARRWLDRAKQRPLSISLWSSIATPTGEVEKALQRTILDRASCIQHLQLDVSRPFSGYISESLPPESWALLEKITITRLRNDAASPGYDVSPEFALWKARQLKAVVWEGVTGDFKRLPLQWEKIEEIRVGKVPVGGRRAAKHSRGTFTPHGLWEIIQKTPKLQSLQASLNGEGGMEDGAGSGWPVTKTLLILPYLTNLDLNDTYLDPTLPQTMLLHNLRLPALTSLWYQLDSNRDEPPPSEHHPLVRFFCSQDKAILVRSFKIHELSITRSGFFECLRMMPLLQRLWICHEERGMSCPSSNSDHGVAVDETFLPEFGLLCPRLASFRIDRANVEFEDVKNFAASRAVLASSTHDACQAPFSRLRQLSIGVARGAPEGYDGGRRRFKIPLEEDLWKLGVKPHITTMSRLSPSLFSFMNPKYDPRDGMLGIVNVDADWD